ncbi:MAG TPA: DUF6687 family protein [Planctomycetota bacterium]|nr:DUF6687 family protein [Planctomycetota bacterium]
MFTPNPTGHLQLGFAGPTGCAVPHLSVDGMTPSGPNLSHWPGNRTPRQWQADLSTGIALRFSRAPAPEQTDFLGDAELVVNDHYDTDGFGSLLAVLRPELAHSREELLLAAAATGDFGVWQTWRGFAIDRIVTRLADADSPLHAAFRGVTDADELCLRRYAWLLEHATAVLDHPGSFGPLYTDEMARVRLEIDAGLRGSLDRRSWPQLGFAALTSPGPQHRMTLNTLAGAHRVLHVETGAAGPLYRYHDRTESWFELVTIQPLPRTDLRPLAAVLDELEPAHDGASWNADPPGEPIPELYFGVPGPQPYGRLTRDLRPSRLPPARVVDAFVSFFANAAAAQPWRRPEPGAIIEARSARQEPRR